MFYRCYLTDGDGHFCDILRIIAASDMEALSSASTSFADVKSGMAGFELWLGDRLVHEEKAVIGRQRT